MPDPDRETLAVQQALRYAEELGELYQKERARAEELGQAYTALERKEAQRRKLLTHLVRAQEEERRRIAGDIHDDSVQVMIASVMSLEILARELRDSQEAQEIKEVTETVRKAVLRLRELMFVLSPAVLDREGLAAALRQYMGQTSTDEGPLYRLDDRSTAEPSTDTATILYRIAQEALANVRKHARAAIVEITVENDDEGFLIRISDDGVGFSPEEISEYRPGHLGMVAMRERAEVAGGWTKVESAPGVGTTVEAWIPAAGKESRVAG